MSTAHSSAGTIFISYRREDTSGHAGRLYDRLSAHFGDSRIFMDIDTIKPGVDFVTVIDQAVASCAVLLALIGQEWLTVTDRAGRRRLDDPHDFNRLEIQSGLTRETVVIPVLVQGAPMPRTEDLPSPMGKLARRNAIELSDARWDYDVQRLIGAIEEVVGKTEPARQQRRKLSPWLLAAAAAAVIAVAVVAAVFLFGGGTPACGGTSKGTGSIATSEIAFLSDRDNNPEVYGINSGGFRLTRFTHDGVDELRPDWSPDGKRLVFGVGSAGPNHSLCIMNSDRSSAQLLHPAAGDEQAPDWSPDGNQIAFASGSKAHSNIFVINADGSGQPSKLTNNDHANGQPDWSPSGKIAFSSNPQGNFDIFVMNGDGTNVHPLIAGPHSEKNPAWSPDGSRILFLRSISGQTHVFVAQADGSGIKPLTHGPVQDSSPTWAPGGGMIAFSRRIASNRPLEIYTLRLGDVSPQVLTRNSGNNVDPAWRP